MIEEMYAEMSRRKIRTGNEDEANHRRNHKIIENHLFTMKWHDDDDEYVFDH